MRHLLFIRIFVFFDVTRPHFSGLAMVVYRLQNVCSSFLFYLCSFQASSANNEVTVEPKNALNTQTIGQKIELSFFDAKLANLAYCPSKHVIIASIITSHASTFCCH